MPPGIFYPQPMAPSAGTQHGMPAAACNGEHASAQTFPFGAETSA